MSEGIFFMWDELSVLTPSLEIKSFVSVEPASGIVVCMVSTPSNGKIDGRSEAPGLLVAGEEPVSFFLLEHAPSVSRLMRTRSRRRLRSTLMHRKRMSPSSLRVRKRSSRLRPGSS